MPRRPKNTRRPQGQPEVNVPGTRTAERDLAADGLEDLARIERAHGRHVEADELEERAGRIRWALS